MNFTSLSEELNNLQWITQVLVMRCTTCDDELHKFLLWDKQVLVMRYDELHLHCANARCNGKVVHQILQDDCTHCCRNFLARWIFDNTFALMSWYIAIWALLLWTWVVNIMHGIWIWDFCIQCVQLMILIDNYASWCRHKVEGWYLKCIYIYVFIYIFFFSFL